MFCDMRTITCKEVLSMVKFFVRFLSVYGVMERSYNG